MAVRPKATEKGGMVITATLMKRKEAPQMRLSKSSITKFRSDIVSSFSKKHTVTKTAWGMEHGARIFRIAHCEFRIEGFDLGIENFEIRNSKFEMCL
jgi:hypothetical protein